MECVQSGSYIFHFCLTLDKINKNFNLKCKKYWFWKYLEMISSSIKTRNIKNYINNRWFIKCSFTTRTYTQLFSFIHRQDVQTTIRRNGTAVWTTSQENQLFPFIFLIQLLEWSTYRPDSILARSCDVRRRNRLRFQGQFFTVWEGLGLEKVSARNALNKISRMQAAF